MQAQYNQSKLWSVCFEGSVDFIYFIEMDNSSNWNAKMMNYANKMLLKDYKRYRYKQKNLLYYTVQ